MRYIHIFLLLLGGLIFLNACDSDESEPETVSENLLVTYVYIGDEALSTNEETTDIALDEPIEIRFNKAVDPLSANQSITLKNSDGQEIPLTFVAYDQNKMFQIEHPVLEENTSYLLTLSENLEGENNEQWNPQQYSFKTLIRSLVLEAVSIDDANVSEQQQIVNVSLEPAIQFAFNIPVSADVIADYLSFTGSNNDVDVVLTQVDSITVLCETSRALDDWRKYKLVISSDIEEKIDRPFDEFELEFYTQLDSTPKFPVISDDELLTKIQQQTFKYFWDWGHPVSGLARERNTSGHVVTTGGSGFGIMALIVGMERGFITREQGIERLTKIVDFLASADRFHGAWPHWLNGDTGQAVPFSDIDDGGDLVETSFLAAGLLAARQYLDSSHSDENELISQINSLWNSIEWDWYTRDGQNVLYWHWSPNFGWEMNMKIQGYNEALITYILAASSSTHPVDAQVYHQGWALNGDIVNGDEYYGYTLPLGHSYGGPLFFAHYSFLGLDPRNLSDQYADYWEQNVNHTLINRQHCIENPNHFVGYGPDCWGLTASDNHEGYSAHSPTNDLGVITPTAAISSLPYTPNESMQAIRFFYYQLGDRLWGDYGFYDAFNITEDWVADSYLAIDQGPIVVMIENYRSGLIWELLMSCPEIQAGLTKLGFNF